jgi:hypothetical protein
MREHWRDIHYWYWLWQRRVPWGAKVTTLGVVLFGLAAGGWGAADRLTSASGGQSSSGFVFDTTVEKLVTVRERGRLVEKLVPTRVRARVRRETVYRTQPKYVTRVVSASGPVSRVARRITVNGKPVTVVATRQGPSGRVTTEALTRTVTNTQNVTQPAEIVTATQTNTLTRTETRVETTTRVATQTVTSTHVETVTQPAVTVTVPITVTVTIPKPH